MEIKNNAHNIIEFINSNRNVLDIITDLVPIPLFMKDRAGIYIDCNSAFTKFLTLSREEIIGKSVYDICSKNEADVFSAQDNELLKNGGLQVYESQITSPDGNKHIVEFHKQVFMDANGEAAGFLGVIFDITEKKNLENALAKQAKIDDLTGLLNRREGMSRLKIIHEESKQNNRIYSIAMIDIDHFKKVNDRYGHSNGDIVIKEFANLAKNILRDSDICFRYGGEEFVVILPETEKNEGVVVVERLRKAWSNKEIMLSNEVLIHSTISIGLKQCDSNCISYEELINESDRAMYEGKNKGRNCTICAS